MSHISLNGRLAKSLSCRDHYERDAMRAIGYLRVSKAEGGAGLDAQRAAIRAGAAARGWGEPVWKIDNGLSGGLAPAKRPALAEALDQLAAGEAGALIVSKLDRLSRSMLDLPGLLDLARRQGWALVCLDLGVDTSDPAGEAMASVIGTFAHFERRRISERTREALAVKRAQGVRLGRPRQLPLSTVERIERERAEGRTLAAIAAGLVADAVPTARGGEWSPSRVWQVLRSGQLDREAEAAAA